MRASMTERRGVSQEPEARPRTGESGAQGPEPREAALSRVEHDTAGQQERTHRQVVREGRQDARAAGKPTTEPDAVRSHR